jgi:peptide methionine sulfoxide reductase msrA/msrB
MPRTARLAILAAAVFIALAGWKGIDAWLGSSPVSRIPHVSGGISMAPKVVKTEKEWKESLTPEQFKVMRQCGTEPPFSGKFNNHDEKGTYVCAACGAPLFKSDAKYDHGTGWPSFTAPAGEESIELREDRSFLMKRTEVRCSSCGAHLGHVFHDGPAPTFEHYCINSAALDFSAWPGAEKGPGKRGQAAPPDPKAPGKFEMATFAAGCFWGVEDAFRKVKGVTDAAVGYTGGKTKNPTYSQVCTDRTGHAEAVRVVFDPAVVGYEELVRYFFKIHDPTEIDRQGPDVGTQYRSVIFTHGEAQREIALRIIEELNASGAYVKPIATGIVPAGEFTRAEEYHQRFNEKHPLRACQR